MVDEAVVVAAAVAAVAQASLDLVFAPGLAQEGGEGQEDIPGELVQA